MASGSSSYYISVVFSLLCMCIHLCAGQGLLPELTEPFNHPPPQIPRNQIFDIQTPPSASASPTPAPAPEPSTAPSPAPVPTPHSFLKSRESAKHKRGRILGLVLISFAGALQAFVVLFLFIKRRQMLKHVRGSRDHRDPPHIWPNA